MNKWTIELPAVLFACGLLGGGIAACGAAPHDSPTRAPGTLASSNAQAGSASTAQPAAARDAGSTSTNGPLLGAAGGTAHGGATPPGVSNTAPDDADCSTNPLFKKEGCSCHTGDTAACWTGSTADRNVGKCHDGLQICSASNEFSVWGPCMGEQLDCGTSDAGVPPPPPPPPGTDCGCIPGAVIQCSEDCSVGIVCSLTATKTCLPDQTWSVCREEAGVQLDVPGVQCRNMLHGCLDLLDPGMPGQTEIYVGDCSTQFKCGHPPDPSN